MEEQLVGFKLAILAREKGFEENCSNYYNTNEEGTRNDDKLRTVAPMNHNYKPWGWATVSVPTQGLLQKWLREKHSIDIDGATTFSRKYSFILYVGASPVPYETTGDYDTYEDALEEALYEGLKIIS